jgi:hypothetical protein
MYKNEKTYAYNNLYVQKKFRRVNTKLFLVFNHWEMLLGEKVLHVLLPILFPCLNFQNEDRKFIKTTNLRYAFILVSSPLL